MKKLLRLSASDFKLIFRDPSLRGFLALPLLIFAVLNLFMPWLINQYPVMENYVQYVVIVATIEVTQMFGFIYSMVLVDEKETEVNKVYGVIPVSKPGLVFSRLIIPLIITISFTIAVLALQPFYNIPILATLQFSLLNALLVPVYVLGVSLFAKNKMEAMVWIKVFNVLVVIPIAAFFLPSIYWHFFGIFPSHWMFQALHNIIDNGEPSSWLFAVGFAYLLLIAYIVLKRFSKTHFA